MENLTGYELAMDFSLIRGKEM